MFAWVQLLESAMPLRFSSICQMLYSNALDSALCTVRGTRLADLSYVEQVGPYKLQSEGQRA